VTKKTEDLMADGTLKTAGKCDGDDHHSYADHGGGYGQSHDESRKALLRIEGDAAGDESG
jgi:hypothetical protein